MWRHERALLDVLRETYGGLRLYGLEGSYGWVLKYDQQARARALGIETLGDYLAMFGHPSAQPLPSLTHLSLNRHLPRLRSFFALPREFRPNWANARWLDRLCGPELFLGPRGSGFSAIHQDHAAVHVGFCQIHGEKQFILFPPEDSRCMYRYRGAQFPYQMRNSRVHTADYRDFERFPRLRHAHPVSIVLRAGQGLFLPSNWWHGTVNLTDSVSFSIRIVNATNVAQTLAAYVMGLPRALLRVPAGIQMGAVSPGRSRPD